MVLIAQSTTSLWTVGKHRKTLGEHANSQNTWLFSFLKNAPGPERANLTGNAFKSQSSNMIIITIKKKDKLSVLKGSRTDNRSTRGPSLFTYLLRAKLHHRNCLLFTLIYLDCDNRGLMCSQGFDVIEDLGIDFWFTRARPICFWMRHAGVDLEKTIGFGYPSNGWKVEQ